MSKEAPSFPSAVGIMPCSKTSTSSIAASAESASPAPANSTLSCIDTKHNASGKNAPSSDSKPTTRNDLDYCSASSLDGIPMETGLNELPTSISAPAAASAPAQATCNDKHRLLFDQVDTATNSPHTFRAKKTIQLSTYWTHDDSSADEQGNTSDASDMTDLEDDRKMPAVSEAPEKVSSGSSTPDVTPASSSSSSSYHSPLSSLAADEVTTKADGQAAMVCQPAAVADSRMRWRTEPRGAAKNHCGRCEGCMVDDCGNCDECLNMVRFGGSYRYRMCQRRPKCLIYGIKRKANRIRQRESLTKPKAQPDPQLRSRKVPRHERRSTPVKTSGNSDVVVGANVWVRPEHCLPGENQFLSPATIIEITDIDDEEGISVKYSPSDIIEFVSIERITANLGKRKRQQNHPETSTSRTKSTFSSTPVSTRKQMSDRRDMYRDGKRLCYVKRCTKQSQGARCNFMCIRHHKESIGRTVKSDPETKSSSASSRRRIVVNSTGASLATPTAKQKSSFLARLHHAMEHSSVEQIKKIFSSARIMLSETLHDEDILIVMRGLVRDPFRRDMGNGESFSFNLLHVWAYYRYNDADKKAFLRDGTADQDAVECLEFLLVEGADIRSKSSDSQTVLHIAMSLGYDNVIKALIAKYDISLNDLMPLDRFGDTPLHGAISSGCLETFNTLLEVSEASEETILDWIEKVKDVNGNSLLIQLIRFTDIKYDCRPRACRDSVNRSETFQLLDFLLKLIAKHERYDLLLERNDAGDNIACIAGKMGQIYEARAVLDICVPLTNKAIANRCGELKRENGKKSQVSPLQWAIETRDALSKSIHASDRRKKRIKEMLKCRGVSALDYFYDHKDDSRLENWLDSANKTVKLLENISKNETVDIEFVENIRPGTILASSQVLSKESEALKQSFECNHQKAGTERVNCVDSVDYWKRRINKESPKTRKEIESILGGQCHAINKYTEIRVIRDPTHPCVHNSGPCDIQVGLFAKTTIPTGTIICEYTGLVARESDHYDSESPYTMNLHALDQYFASKGASIYSESIVLDAAKYFNEGALVNDPRGSPFGDDDENHKKENCEYIEVQVGNWPHIFIGCHGCAKGEELTVDYGPIYWSKKANLMQQERLSAQEAEIERLKEELLKTRKRMVFQEDQDKYM